MERFCGPFSTPNVAGLITGILTITLAILYEQYGRRDFNSRLLGRVISVIFASISLLCLVMLVLSKSRAGYLALIVGVVVGLLGRTIRPRVGVLLLAIQFILMLIVPGNTERFVGTSFSQQQARFDLWWASLRLIGDFPFTGAGGLGQEILNSYLLDVHYFDRFNTSLNDALTLCVRGGLPLLVAYVFLLALPIVDYIKSRGHNYSVIGHISVTGLSVYIVASQFQAHLWYPVSSSALLVLWVMWCLDRIFHARIKRQNMDSKVLMPLRMLLTSFIISLVISAGITGVGIGLAKSSNFKISMMEDSIYLAPRTFSTKPSIILFSDVTRKSTSKLSHLWADNLLSTNTAFTLVTNPGENLIENIKYWENSYGHVSAVFASGCVATTVWTLRRANQLPCQNFLCILINISDAPILAYQGIQSSQLLVLIDPTQKECLSKEEVIYSLLEEHASPKDILIVTESRHKQRMAFIKTLKLNAVKPLHKQKRKKND